MSFEVRLGSSSDAPELARLRLLAELEDRQAATDQSLFIAQFVRWAAAELSGPDWKVWVADREGHLVGHVYLQEIHKVPRARLAGRTWGYLTAFYVQAESRREGIGARLVEAAVMWARVSKLEFVAVWPSPQSVALLRRLGFSGDEEVLHFELDR